MAQQNLQLVTAVGNKHPIPVQLIASPSVEQGSTLRSSFDAICGLPWKTVALAATAVAGARNSHISRSQRVASVTQYAKKKPAKKSGKKDKKEPEVEEEPAWDPNSEIGAIAPLGFFDPLEFATDQGKLNRLRQAELKHGRVAMLACVGAVAQHYIRFPTFEKCPAGISAIYTNGPSELGWTVLLAAILIMEIFVWKQDPSKEPGNFGDPLGLNMYTTDMRNKEVNNGRFAMFAAQGIIWAEIVTGKDAVEQLSGLPLPTL